LNNGREGISFHLGQPAALVVLDALKCWSFGDWADAAAHSVTLEWVNLSHGINLNLGLIFLVVPVESKSEFIIVIQHGLGHNRVSDWNVGIGHREVKHTAPVSPHIKCVVQGVDQREPFLL